jgi:hypothetical protein
LAVWSHTDSWDFGHGWTPGDIANTIFFFASGIFFKTGPCTDFLIKRVQRLLVPFFFFYILSIPFRILVDLWDQHGAFTFDWSRILDLFIISERSDYLSLNVPIWFLWTTFVIHLLANVLFRLPKWGVLLLALCSLFFQKELLAWPTIFMFNNALGWFGFFALGYLTGKPLINVLSVARQRRRLLAVLGTIFIVSWLWVDIFQEQDSRNLLLNVRKIAFTMLLLSLLSFFNQTKGVPYLKYVGEQSLVVLGSHLWILIPILRICHKLFGSGHGLLGGAMAILTLALSIPLIRFLNRKLPMLVGVQRKS